MKHLSAQLSPSELQKQMFTASTKFSNYFTDQLVHFVWPSLSCNSETIAAVYWVFILCQALGEGLSIRSPRILRRRLWGRQLLPCLTDKMRLTEGQLRAWGHPDSVSGIKTRSKYLLTWESFYKFFFVNYSLYSILFCLSLMSQYPPEHL